MKFLHCYCLFLGNKLDGRGVGKFIAEELIKRRTALQMKSVYACKQDVMKLVTQTPTEMHHQFTCQSFEKGSRRVLFMFLTYLIKSSLF